MRLPLTFASGLLTGLSVLALAGAYQEPDDNESSHALSLPEEPTPPEGQSYVGTLKCASCHFDQYQDWRTKQAKHAKAFDILPAAYREDPTCLECHTTGYGHPTGYKTAGDRQLAGISCESCHGPGSEHMETAKKFISRRDLGADQKKLAADLIYRMVPENVCVECHITRAHGTHPEYNR